MRLNSEPSIDQPWVAAGKRFLGLKEISGSNHNPEILKFWKAIRRSGIKDDETPWCAAFVGACLENSGIESTRFESAKSYLTWGVTLSKPVPGCVAVFTRNGGGHIGFVLDVDSDGFMQLLGGNQNDSVCIRSYGTERLARLCWPRAVPIPDQCKNELSFKSSPKNGREV
jgi:uncharacterized protein (TIGR02594 family)